MITGDNRFESKLTEYVYKKILASVVAIQARASSKQFDPAG
jgi:hypothetical protein